jgi:hypothetical protein
MIYWKCDFKQENKCKSLTHKTIRTNYETKQITTSCLSSVLCCFLFLFFCTPPFCRFRVCYLDFALSLDSVVFFNNPFTLFLRYSVDYIWSTMEQWRQYLGRFLYTSYDFLWSPPLFLNNADSYKLSYL